MRTALALVLLWPLAASAQIPAETLKRIKDATVLILVRESKGGSAGSGFVVKQDGDDLYIVTNDHVIDPDHKKNAAGMAVAQKTKVDIRVVFDSGQPTERAVKGLVVAADPQRDLAVLKVSKVKDPPQVLDITDPPPLQETMQVAACGFPFGTELGEGKNPEITITPGTVSSIRKNALGQVSTVQLAISLNPGNSGGPVVSSKDGKLIGVAVRSILGAGIGEAVPQTEVMMMLRGRPGPLTILPKNPGSAGPATLTVSLIDPLKAIKSVTGHVRATKPEKVPAPTEIMEGATKVEMMIEEGVATGEVEAPADGAMMVQLEVETADGKLVIMPVSVPIGPPRMAPGGRGDTPPGRPEMPGRDRSGKPRARMPGGHIVELPAWPVDEAPKPAEGITNLSDFSLKPETYLDQSITIEGLSNFQLRPLPKGEYEMTVFTEAGQPPANVRIVLPKDLGLQMSEIFIQEIADFKYALRLAGRVMKPGNDLHTLEVSEVNFLDPEGKALTTLKPAPVAPGGEATLSIVNRFPAEFKGKPVSIKAHLAGMDNAEKGLALRVNHESVNRVMNLKFFVARDLSVQVQNDVPGDGALVKLDGTIEAIDPKTGMGIFGVSAVTVLDAEGKEKKKLEGKEKINYPSTAIPPAPKVAKPKEETVAAVASAAPVETKRRGETPQAESGNLMLYLGIGGGVGVVMLIIGFFVLMQGKKASEPKYGRKAAPAREEDPKEKPKPPPLPVAKPAAPPKPARQPPAKSDDNPFANFG